jgi:hypothetical protein
MAFAATVVVEVRSDGDDLNGGGFDSAAAGTDYSQQAAAQLTVTDAAGTGTTTLTSAQGGFTAAMIGNVVYIQGQGRYVITARTDTNTVTVDRNLGTFSGATAKVGGALASLGHALTYSTMPLVDGNLVYVRQATYSVASGITTGVAGRVEIIGYGTTRTDGLKPTLSATDAIAVLTLNHTNWTVRNFVIDGNDLATFGIDTTSGNTFAVIEDVDVLDCTKLGINLQGPGSRAWRCTATGCGAFDTPSSSTQWGGFGLDQYCSLYECESYDNDGHGVYLDGEGGTVSRCLIYGNSGAGVLFYEQWQLQLLNCTVQGNTLSGLLLSGSAGGYAGFVANNLFVGNARYGIEQGTTDYSALAWFGRHFTNNGFYNNTLGATRQLPTLLGSVTLTADPFTSAATDDYSLNSAAGGGTACKDVATPGVFPRGLVTGYLDLGAVEAQGAAADDAEEDPDVVYGIGDVDECSAAGGTGTPTED